ncbi:hypothetical protein GUJ93_ZPchr0007g4414 [Zizania palustris]|uniref:Uncharacterized protein n=1 Tax=Zizania palustris TaxID=103762 RepID=A0A8J5TCR6_ZIZPA|nr:hypothetical protein GUJ93_ZPchr0007g4414 [Zizania palustris]
MAAQKHGVTATRPRDPDRRRDRAVLRVVVVRKRNTRAAFNSAVHRCQEGRGGRGRRAPLRPRDSVRLARLAPSLRRRVVSRGRRRSGPVRQAQAGNNGVGLVGERRDA